MHLADAFFQSDLHCIQVTVFYILSALGINNAGLTMQINFHSLLWSYLPRVLIFLAMTVQEFVNLPHTHYCSKVWGQ